MDAHEDGSSAATAAPNDPNPAASTRYDPEVVETRWIGEWDRRRVFEADVDEDREPYTIVVPPPNVTGALHMGHALNGSVQDCLIRFKRMCGYNALWIPGVDHAGIATQSVVEKELRREGTTRFELGREAFLERVQQWKDQYAATIHGQFRRLGSSMDFRRARFTMDEGYVRAVLEAFVRLHARGAIYRGSYLVNWDAGSMSAISDLEVENRTLVDELVEIAYPLEDGSGEIVVATVRPETVVADVAVAVHPDDERYGSLVGARVRVPLTDRTVPVIADDYVDPAFGTGALKITPGHDPNDFEIGRRHGLPQLSAIAPDRTMTDVAGRGEGRPVDQARDEMVAELEAQGLIRAREPYTHNVPHSQRSGMRIEPLISLQWFADMGELARPAIEAARSGAVRFVPEGSKRIFDDWMENLRPWCLSRQLWWGHQLPVWYCAEDEAHVHVSVEGPADGHACPECGCTQWRRDEDVLDTWFSSGLWDSATLGWPDDTPDLRYFHPTSVLCTARDIINLWVARMMMFSLDFLGEVPFHDVYIHSVIQASDGRRMSKSLGTGVDPLDLIARYGADATRYGLLDMSSTQDVRFNEGRIREGRDLANKLWNASRLLAVMTEPAERAPLEDPSSVTEIEDRWIMARLDRVSREVTAAIEGYEFALAVKALYRFVWHELCDWYLESVKQRLRDGAGAEDGAPVGRVLALVLDRTLRLVHPVMPHVTEEIADQLWGADRADGGCVATSTWHASALPDPLPEAFASAEESFARLQAMVVQLRALGQAADLRGSAYVSVPGLDPGELALLASLASEPTRTMVAIADGAAPGGSPEDGSQRPVRLVVGGSELTLWVPDSLVPALRTSQERALATARSELARSRGKLANERFVAGARPEVVEAERRSAAEHERVAAELEGVLAQLA